MTHPIESICSRDPTRFNLMKPHRCPRDGEVWTGATDGHHALLIRGELPVELSKVAGPDLWSVVPKKVGGVAVDREALLAWSGGPMPPPPPCPCGGTKKKTCIECDGKKRVPHVCNCDHCWENNDDCEFCKGTGTVTCECIPAPPPPAHGVLGGVAVNRWLVGNILTAAPAGPVLVQAGEDETPFHPFVLHGEGWLGLIMPVRSDAKTKETLPAFSLPTTVVGGSLCPRCAKGDHSQHQKQLGGICVGCACTATPEAA